MSSFTVTPESLHALEGLVLGLAAELYKGPSATDGMMSTYQSKPGIGISGVGDTSEMDITGGQLNGVDVTVHTFFAAWYYSLGEIGGNMERVAKALAAAAQRYTEVDNNVIPAKP
jgi:hypothetical protein